MHLVYPQGAGGHFLCALLNGATDLHPPGNDFFNTVYNQNQYGQKYYGRHRVETTPQNTVVVYPASNYYKEYCHKLYVIKKLYDGQTYKDDYSTIRTVEYFTKRYDPISIEQLLERLHKYHEVCKRYNFALSSRAVIKGILTGEDFILSTKKELEQTPDWLEDYPDLEAAHKYTYEKIFVMRDLDDTIFSKYKREIKRYHERNIQLLAETTEKLCQIC